MTKTETAVMTSEEWHNEGVRRFGPDMMTWKFVCPVCKHVASVQEWKDAGAESGQVAFSCIGRLLPKPRIAFGGGGPGPCNYAGGGLFRLNPLSVDCDGVVEQYFNFAEVSN